jgi:predicted DNA-binding protein (MmcQ/YjbR family)
MNYPWLDAYCLSLKGAQKDYKVEWSATRYLLHDKMFAMVGGDKSGKPIVSLKLAPENGEVLRATYEDIIPGYYMNKVHWNSVYLEGCVPDEVLKKMITESHELILSGLTKKQRALLE